MVVVSREGDCICGRAALPVISVLEFRNKAG